MRDRTQLCPIHKARHKLGFCFLWVFLLPSFHQNEGSGAGPLLQHLQGLCAVPGSFIPPDPLCGTSDPPPHLSLLALARWEQSQSSLRKPQQLLQPEGCVPVSTGSVTVLFQGLALQSCSLQPALLAHWERRLEEEGKGCSRESPGMCGRPRKTLLFFHV